MRKHITPPKLITYTIAVIGLIVLVITFLELFFTIKDYRYFEYNNQKYYLDSNLNISDTINYDEHGEFHSYKNCVEVIVKINGWFPKKMLLYNFGEDQFIFDIEKLIWGIKNGEDLYPKLEIENITSVIVEFWDECQDYALDIKDIEKTIDIANDLKNNSAQTISWENAPNGTKNGTLDFSYKDFPKNVTYSTFYFSVTEKGIFLMSLTDICGLKYGSYIILDE